MVFQIRNPANDSSVCRRTWRCLAAASWLFATHAFADGYPPPPGPYPVERSTAVTPTGPSEPRTEQTPPTSGMLPLDPLDSPSTDTGTLLFGAPPVGQAPAPAADPVDDDRVASPPRSDFSMSSQRSGGWTPQQPGSFSGPTPPNFRGTPPGYPAWQTYPGPTADYRNQSPTGPVGSMMGPSNPYRAPWPANAERRAAAPRNPGPVAAPGAGGTVFRPAELQPSD